MTTLVDKHKKKVKAYMTLGLKRADIARLLGCHPRTVSRWLKGHGLDQYKGRPNRKNKNFCAVLRQIRRRRIDCDDT